MRRNQRSDAVIGLKGTCTPRCASQCPLYKMTVKWENGRLPTAGRKPVDDSKAPRLALRLRIRLILKPVSVCAGFQRICWRTKAAHIASRWFREVQGLREQELTRHLERRSKQGESRLCGPLADRISLLTIFLLEKVSGDLGHISKSLNC